MKNDNTLLDLLFELLGAGSDFDLDKEIEDLAAIAKEVQKNPQTMDFTILTDLFGPIKGTVTVSCDGMKVELSNCDSEKEESTEQTDNSENENKCHKLRQEFLEYLNDIESIDPSIIKNAGSKLKDGELKELEDSILNNNTDPEKLFQASLQFMEAVDNVIMDKVRALKSRISSRVDKAHPSSPTE